MTLNNIFSLAQNYTVMITLMLGSNLLPLVSLAPRLILAGDHLQLPPVLHTEEARQLGLHVR